MARLESWLVSSRPIPTSAGASFRIQKPAAAEEEESVDGEIEAAEEWKRATEVMPLRSLSSLINRRLSPRAQAQAEAGPRPRRGPSPKVGPSSAAGRPGLSLRTLAQSVGAAAGALAGLVGVLYFRKDADESGYIHTFEQKPIAPFRFPHPQLCFM